MKFKKILAWFALILTGGITIGLIVFAITGTRIAWPMFLRGLIVLPFGVWWGLKTLRGAREEVDPTFEARLKDLERGKQK